MNIWYKKQLKDICSKIGSGATPKGGDAAYISEGISLIRSQNVLDFTFSKDGLAFINEQQAKGLANVTVQPKDVLLNITGDSVARVCQVPEDVLPARVNQHVAILRADNNKLVPEFLKYALLAKPTKELLLTYASTGATRKALTKGMLEEFEINLPSLPTQQKIAEILSALDDKIELNRRMNQTLEQMAQTLFRQFFVDGIDSENLPEGWRIGKVGELASIQNGYAFKSKDFIEEGENGVIKIRNINSNVVDIHTTQFVPSNVANSVNDKFKVSSGDILIAMTGAEVGKIGIVPNTEKSLYLNQRVGSFKEKLPFSNNFVYILLTSESYQEELRTTAMGSAQPNISGTDIEGIKCILPPLKTVSEFGEKVKPLFEKICQNQKENFILSTTRDTLLPKLMSGEIDVMQTQTAGQYEEVLS